MTQSPLLEQTCPCSDRGQPRPLPNRTDRDIFAEPIAQESDRPRSVDDQPALGFQAFLGELAVLLTVLIRRGAWLTLRALLGGARCGSNDTIGFREFDCSMLNFGACRKLPTLTVR